MRSHCDRTREFTHFAAKFNDDGLRKLVTQLNICFPFEKKSLIDDKDMWETLSSQLTFLHYHLMTKYNRKRRQVFMTALLSKDTVN